MDAVQAGRRRSRARSALRTASVAVALVAGAACSAPAAQQQAPAAPAESRPAWADVVEPRLAAIVSELRVPGAVVAVRSESHGDATFAFGTTDLAGGRTPTMQDHFRVGSVTKTMTAAVILQLADEGLLSVSDPVSRHLPDVPGGDRITIANLMDMRSGLSSYDEELSFYETLDRERAKVWTTEELSELSFARPPLAEPDTTWHYTNINYIMLGEIMERLTGRTVPELFTERLFTPLGMTSTSFPATTDATIPEPFAHGYQFGASVDFADPTAGFTDEQRRELEAGTLLPGERTFDNPSWGWTAGATISTPEDMLRWARELTDGTLLEPATQQARLASVRPVGEAAPNLSYGYGVIKVDDFYWHNGGLPGYNTWVGRDPVSRTTIVVNTTLVAAPDGRGPADALANAVREALPRTG